MSQIKSLLPRTLRLFLRKIYYAQLDTIDFLSGKRRGLVPPRRMAITIGGGDIEAVGKEFLELFIHYGQLKPTDSVLDVGCGVGRMALQLIHHLTPPGRYEGFDIVRDEINWCRRKITPRYPHFHFQLSDIYNNVYNPTGTLRAADYVFPFDDESFDFIFLTSVFTHLLPADMEHYTSEIARVLKKNGRTFITYFLLNNESKRCLENKSSTLDFSYELTGCKTTNEEHPESAVAFEQEEILALYTRLGLTVESPVRYGSWCGRPEYLTYQDVVIATK